MPWDTGSPRADAEDDFLRARRHEYLSRLVAWLRREPDDVNLILPFDEVVGALGRVSERELGLRTVALDSIVGTVDKTRDFDRWFRPTSARVRQRWQRIAAAQRRGEPIPPIDVYRVGDLHFVRDGHHRVSVALAQRRSSIDAYVTEVVTRVTAQGIVRRGDILLKDYERIFRLRVPLSAEQAAEITVTDPWNYAELAENVEAWGYRCIQERGEYLDREAVALLWFEQEYRPVVAMLRHAGLLGRGTDAEAYMRVAKERYRLVRTHTWGDDVITRIRDGGSRG